MMTIEEGQIKKLKDIGTDTIHIVNCMKKPYKDIALKHLKEWFETNAQICDKLMSDVK